MAILRFKDENNHFIPVVQDVKVNDVSVFDGKEAIIIIKSIDNISLVGDGNISFKTINGTSITGEGDIPTEVTTNKVTSISSSSTDTQYPSAKCMYDIIGDVESLLSEV